MKTAVALAVSLLLGMVCTTHLQADVIQWTGGAGDWDFMNPANWDGGSLPANNDYEDIAEFGGSATPGTVTNTNNRRINGIRFTSAGWTLQGGFRYGKGLSSEGAGTNTIHDLFEAAGNRTWTVVAGNTLVITGSAINHYDHNMTLSGGGVLHGTQRLDCADWGGDRTFTISDGVLRVDSDRPYQGGDNGVIHIGSENGYLELQTDDVAAVESLFGADIVDDTGLGLTATDMGEYVRVGAVPEPATLSLLVLAGGLAVTRRRR